MGQFTSDVSNLVARTRPQARSGGGAGGGMMSLPTVQRGGSIGQAWGQGIGTGMAQMFDPDMQRERASKARDVLLSMPEEQRNIVIRRPDVQAQLKSYSRYMPTMFHDAGSVTGNPDLEGVLTVTDDKFYEQKYMAGETQIEEGRAQTGKTKAVTQAVKGQEGRDEDLHPLVKAAKETGIALTAEQIEQVKASTKATQGREGREGRAEGDIRSNLRARTANVERNSAEQQRQTTQSRSEQGLDWQQKVENVQQTAAQTKYIEAQTAKLQNVSGGLEEYSNKAIDKKVAGEVKVANDRIKELGRNLATTMKTGADAEVEMAIGVSGIARNLVGSLGLVDTLKAGKEMQIARIVGSPEIFNLVDEALSRVYRTFKNRRDELTQEQIDEMYANVSQMFNSSYDEIMNYAPILSPQIIDYMGWPELKGTPYKMMQYIEFVATGKTMTPEERGNALREISAAGGLEFEVEQKDEKRFGWFGLRKLVEDQYVGGE